MLFHIPTSAQLRTTPRNLDVLDTLTREAAQSFAKQLRTPLFPTRTPADTLRIQIHTHEASWLLEQALLNAFPIKKRFRASDTLQAHHRLSVRIADAGVRYFSCKHDVDLLTREISCVLHAHYETNYGTIQELEGFGTTYRDTIQRRALASLENRQYAFTQATVPEAEPNFWKQVIEPAVVIAAAGIMVALFFFVRTQ